MNQSVGHEVENDKTQARQYLDQMIDIANMFPFYDLFGDEVPDYEILLYLYHAQETGKILDLNAPFDDAVEAVNTITVVWNVIEDEYPKLAHYAVAEAYNSVIGEEVFEEVLSDEVYLEVFNSATGGKVLSEEEVLELLKTDSFFILHKPEIAKLQNFVRLTRIAHNMRHIAYLLHKRNHRSPHSDIMTAYKLEWKEVFYHIPSREMMNQHKPFHIIYKNQNNKETGKFQHNSSFMERVLSEIDILQIKICGNCFNIFFAEPRNMKYCSSKCNDRMKSKTYYRKKKRLALGDISDEEMRLREILESFVKKQQKRGWVDEEGEFHPFDNKNLKN